MYTELSSSEVNHVCAPCGLELRLHSVYHIKCVARCQARSLPLVVVIDE